MDDSPLYTSIGHRGMAILNPVSSRDLDAILAVVDPGRDDACAIDVGCGKGELLIRLAARSGCRGLGIDMNPELAAEARAAVRKRAPGRVEILETRAEEYELQEGAHDVAAAVGASHALGGTIATIRALAGTTRAGGHVVLGEGYWRTPPDGAALERMGATRDEMMSLDELLHAIEAEGLTVVRVAEASLEDWDRYEGAHERNLEAYWRENPDDPQAGRLWARRNAWSDVYAAAGRELMGFALIAARRDG